MTSSPPSVESADDLEAAVERCFKENRLGDIISLIAADRKAERAVRAEAANDLRVVLQTNSHQPPMRIAINRIITNLEAGPQPKQEREPR